MAKVSKTDVYPYDTLVTMLDYLLGTDINGNLKTKSYKVQDLADLFLSYVQENAEGLDQDNIFTIIDLGETGLIEQIQGQNIDEALVEAEINTILQNNNLTITEKQIIILKLSVRINVVDDENNFISNVSQTRKYFFPLGKGVYEPLSNSVTADELELAYVEATNIITDANVESNPNNVIFDLGDITGEDFLSYINTETNVEYPTGYPLVNTSKIYYFKWIDDGITYLYYFDEANSLNSYGNYGVDGDFIFQAGELVLFYSSNNTYNPLENLFVKKSFAQGYVYPDVTGADASIPIPANGASKIVLSNASLTSIACLDLTAIIGNPSAEVPYTGKLLQIANATGNDVELKHATGANIQFFTKDGNSIIIPNNETLFVEYDADGVVELFRSWSSGGGSSLRMDKHTFYFTNQSFTASTLWYSPRNNVANSIENPLYTTGLYNGTTEVVDDARTLGRAITFQQKATKITFDYALIQASTTFRIIYYKPNPSGFSNNSIDNQKIHETTIINSGGVRQPHLIEIPVDFTMEVGGNISIAVFNNNVVSKVTDTTVTVDVIEVI
jgi:hypothetical protein